MDETNAIVALNALSQPSRLRIFRRLVATAPQAHAAGDIARALAAPHNTVSTHLATLERAGLIAGRREGRSILYNADLDGFHALVLFLLRDCCGGRAEICAPVFAALSACGPSAPPRSLTALKEEQAYG